MINLHGSCRWLHYWLRGYIFNIRNQISGFVGIAIATVLIILPSWVRESYINETVISKTILFTQCICLILFLFALILILPRKSGLKLSWSSLDFSLLALVGYVFLNRFAFHNALGMSIQVIELSGLILFYIFIRIIPFRAYSYVLYSIILAVIIQCGIGLFQLLGFLQSYHPGFKTTGSFFNPGPYAGFLLTGWSVSLYLFLNGSKENLQNLFGLYKPTTLIITVFQYLPIVGLFAMMLMFPITQSRAAWISVLMSSILLLSNHFKDTKWISAILSNYRTIGMILLIGIGLIFLVVLYLLRIESVNGRFLVWKVSLALFVNNFWFGIGFDEFKSHYMYEQLHYFSKNGASNEGTFADDTYFCFNELLQFAVENGIVGMLFLSRTFFALFKYKPVSRFKKISFALQCSVFSLLLYSFFSYPSQILPIKITMVTFLAILSKISFDKTMINLSLQSVKPLKYIVSVIMFISALGGLIWIERDKVGYRDWKNALSIYRAGHYQESLPAYQSSYKILHGNGDLLMNYGKALSMSGRCREAISTLVEARKHLGNTIIETTLGNCYEAVRKFGQAEGCYRNAAAMNPAKIYPHYLLANMYFISGQKKKAVISASKVLNMQVKVQSVAIDEMRRDMTTLIQKIRKEN